MHTKICSRCVMNDAGDPTIRFDAQMICNYCTDAYLKKPLVYHPGADGAAQLKTIFDRIKEEGKGKKYDCMLGLSGGLDSSYLALVGYRHGLRMLAVHVDDGYDKPVTVENIRKVCDAFHIDLIIEKPDAVVLNDLTAAFIRAGVPNIAIPQDNVLFACLYRYAAKNKIHTFLNGGNFALESILQQGNTWDATDKVHIKDIYKKFGKFRLPKNFPLFSSFERHFKFGLIYRLQFLRPLNYLEYSVKEAFEELEEACGFVYYGDKHCESTLTKLMQRYYLPVKFNTDKRSSHYSSMIVSGQMTRDEALTRMKEPLYDPEELERDISFVLGKLCMAREEFDQIMKEPPHNHQEYKTSTFNRIARMILKILRKNRRKKF